MKEAISYLLAESADPCYSPHFRSLANTKLLFNLYGCACSGITQYVALYV